MLAFPYGNTYHRGGEELASTITKGRKMETKEKTCEERIDSQLTRLEESCADIVKIYYEGDEEGEWNNYPLSVDTYKMTRIQLSWGGPSDFLDVKHDGTIILAVTYHFQDWFDGAVRDIEEGSKVWEYARTVIEAREECGY